MKPENYIKRYALKHGNDNGPFSNVLCYSLVYIKRHKNLYLFETIWNDDYTDFMIKIINKSNKETLNEQLRDMFIFTRELDDCYDYQEIELIEKNHSIDTDGFPVKINLAYVRDEKNKPFHLIDISNNMKGDIKII